MGHRATSLLVLSAGLIAGCITNSNDTVPPFDGGQFEFDVASPDFDTGTPDTSAPPGQPDATVADAGQAPDTGAADAAAPVDATDAADAGNAPVTLIVLDPNGLPEANVGVVFSDATGAVLDYVTTGVSGTLSEAVPAGSQVTVLFGSASNPTLLTIVAVQPGDHLTALDTSQGVNEYSYPVAVTGLPPSPPDAGVDFVVAAGPCQDEETLPTATFNLGVSNGCSSGGKFPLLTTASDVNGDSLAFAYQKGYAVALDGGLDDAGNQDVSMTGASPWTAFGSLTIADTNVPENVYPSLFLEEVAGGVATTSSAGELVQVDAGVQSTTFASHPGYADFVQVETSYFPSSNDNGGDDGTVYVAIATRSAATAPTTAFDLSTAPPTLTGVVLDYANGAQPTIGWTTSAPFPSAVGAVLNFSWQTESEDPSYGSWTFIASPSATTLQAPALPSQAAAWSPAAASSFNSPSAFVFAGTPWSGYDAFRATSGSLVSSSASAIFQCFGGNAPCIPPLPADGTVSFTAFTQEAE